MLDVFLSTQPRDHDNVLESLADMANKYRRTASGDPCQDVLIADVDGQMVGYGRVHWRQVLASGDRVYTMAWYIRPERQGQGLEEAFLERCKERARQIIRQQMEDAPESEAAFGGARLFEAEATDLQPALMRLLEAGGFRAVRWGSTMTCRDLQAISDAPMPPGLATRPVSAEHYRQIWDALLDAFRNDPGYAQPDDDEYARWQHSTQFQPGLWQIAWDGDQVAGMVLNYITREPEGAAQPTTAWTEDICVRRPWRRRGLARALLARSMRMFREMGFTQTSLGVDLNNAESARQLYESMGYQIVHLLIIYRKTVDL
jgi:ribosomal protein S18 acetylase RimI-like enzyme